MPETVKDGDTIRVRYRGLLTNGEVFDESPEGEPLEFQVGTGQVIPGFDEGAEHASEPRRTRLAGGLSASDVALR